MNQNEKDVKLQSKMDEMTNDAKYLHKLVKHRSMKIQSAEAQFKKENRERLSSIQKTRLDHSQIRASKNDAKENERQKITRSLVAALVTSADYPGCPEYVPPMINFMKNISGTFT